jgi:hypothetical protein
MSAAFSPQTLRAIARVATESGRRVRFEMRGRSMLPLLREPMLLEVAPLSRRSSVGDVLVFAWGDIQVAHRVIGYDGENYRTCGDACPLVTENVAPCKVLGRVEAVWQDGSPSTRRIDDGFHRLRGRCFAYSHPIRRPAAAAKAIARNVLLRLVHIARRNVFKT